MDLDGDGHTDILSGSYSRPGMEMAGTFQVLRGQEGGTFAKAETLNGSDGEPLILGASGKYEGDAMIDKICTRPTAADLNGDGHLDIVSGNFSGTFGLFLGEGPGKFSPESTYLEHANGKLLEVEHHSDPFLVDWDADGDLDLISGSSGGDVVMFRNVGDAKNPAFAKAVTLVEGAGHGMVMGGEVVFGDAHVKGPQSDTRVFVADVNGDGKLDLIVGDNARLTFPAEGVSEDEARERMEAWNAEMQELMENAPQVDYQKLDELPEAEQEAFHAHQEKVGAQFEKRSEFVKEGGAGSVWLYLQQ